MCLNGILEKEGNRRVTAIPNNIDQFAKFINH